MKEKSDSFDPKSYHSKKPLAHTKTFDLRILFFDVVGFSKDLHNEKASKTVANIHQAMWSTLDHDYYWAETGKNSSKNSLILIPTGDGYGIAFHPAIKGSDVLKVCVNLYKSLIDAGIKIRVGIAEGSNVVTIDLNEHLNVFGYGIVLATRVCSVAKKKQILIHTPMAEALTQQKPLPDLAKIEKPLKAKHGLKLHCFNYYRKGEFGISL